jgi:hypothetical protein
MSDVKNLTSVTWSSSNPSNVVTATTELDFGVTTPNKISVAIDTSSGSNVKPALITYTNLTDKDYLSKANGNGTLANEVLTAGIITTAGDRESKDFIEISDIKKGDEIEVYFYGTDSKGAPGKATTLRILDGNGGTDTTILAANAEGGVSTSTTAYAKTTANTSGTIRIVAGSSSRVGVAAIVVTSSDDDSDPFKTVTNGAVYVTDTDTYVIAGVSKNDVTTANGVTVTIGKTPIEAGSTVYENVVIDSNTTITNTQVGADYIVAIKVTGANKDARVESFTVKAE